MAADRQVSLGVVVNPGRMSGEPTIKGTRITAEMVANLLEGPHPMRPYSIVENYPSLNFYDLVNVKGWARKGRPC